MVFGPVLGTVLVGFAVLLALFLRDVVLSGNPCTVDAREGPAGVILEPYLKRTRAAAGRLWYETVALVLAGGLLEAGLTRLLRAGQQVP